ncbi:MAG: 3-deoxy-manno-octulosonate cytidylyltransferase [Clostridium celatum]|nr:3-deoxy-manno-octulosonate cytidylyltransferase [Clostridium celatum]
MKIVGVIPARYKSTRFEGKPLADILGRPMIWWVYNQVIQVKELQEVYVATDDERISKICEEFNIKYIMTADNHPNHIHRIQEVSTKIKADYFVCINGDEPLIEPKTIRTILNNNMEINDKPVVYGLVRNFTDPVETIDSANIKIVTNKEGNALYMSRSVIPYPKGSLLYKFKKYVGVECFNKMALDFFVNSEQGELEKIEDIDHLRFLENNIVINFKLVDSKSLSVDTKNDLEKVKIIMQKRKGEE